MTPGLAGEEFLEHWDKATVEDLFRRIKTTMPADHPGSLADADYLDVVAFLIEGKRGSRSARAGSDVKETIR